MIGPQGFDQKHLPALVEFIVAGVVLSLSTSLDTDEDINTFIKIVKKRCDDQEFPENDTNDVLDTLKNAIIYGKKGLHNAL